MRKIILSTGDSMGDEAVVLNTNAPKKVLKALERISSIQESRGCDALIWASTLTTMGYECDGVDSHRHVTAYGTSSSWLEDKYPDAEEHYRIDSGEVADADKNLLASFVAGDDVFMIFGDYELITPDYSEAFRGKPYTYPEWDNLRAIRITDESEEDYAPSGSTFAGREYEIDDMINQFLFETIVGYCNFKAISLENNLAVFAFSLASDSIVVNDTAYPSRIPYGIAWDYYTLFTVTDKYFYYANDNGELLMYDVSERCIISDNYFAEVGYEDSLEAIRNGTEVCFWQDIPEE